MEISPSFLAVASAIVFLASVAKALTGFAFALVLVPLLSLILDPHQVVVISALVNIVAAMSLAIQARRDISYPLLGLMMAGAIPGIPLGLVVLASLDPNPMRVMIGILVIPLAGLFYFGLARSLGRERLSLMISGFLSGVLQGSTTMGGPPVVFCLMSQGHPKETMRGTLLAYFFPLSVLTAAGYGSRGLVSSQEVLTSLILLPAMFLGAWSGSKVFHWASPKLFRGIVTAVIVVAGLLSINAGLHG